jgi:hypothetical protein
VEALDSDFQPSKVVEVTFMESVKLPPGVRWHAASKVLGRVYLLTQ